MPATTMRRCPPRMIFAARRLENAGQASTVEWALARLWERWVMLVDLGQCGVTWSVSDLYRVVCGNRHRPGDKLILMRSRGLQVLLEGSEYSASSSDDIRPK
jgi:hypothetical protein